MTAKEEQLKDSETEKDSAGDSVDKTVEENDNFEKKDDDLKKETDDPEKLLKGETDSAKPDANELQDRLLRVSAEFENYKKRFAREMDDFRKFANEAFAKELLPVLDNLERAVSSSEDNANNEKGLLEGVKKTLKELQKALQAFRVKKIISLDQPFDPRFHQAIMQEEVKDQKSNIVLKELQTGYMIHDRLLRPAMVSVSKAAPEAKTEAKTEAETEAEKK